MNTQEMARLPWRDITDEWNAALESYRIRMGKHWHGTLRGSRGKDFKHGTDNKRSYLLVVVDCWQGKPLAIKPDEWRGYPDFYDFTKIIAQPVDQVFHFGKVREVWVTDHIREHAKRLVELHNASIGKVGP